MNERKTAFLYSNNNYEFAYKLKQICNRNYYNVKNVNNFSELFFNDSFVTIPLLIVDGSELKTNKEIVKMLIELAPKYFKHIIFFFIEEHDVCLNSLKHIFFIDNEVDLEINLSQALKQIDFTYKTNDVNIKQKWVKIVSDYLDKLGFLNKHLGYQMLKDSIIYCFLNSNAASNFSNTLYNYLASKYFTTIYNVERAIRRAIDYVWKNNFKQEKIPTNKSFILKSVGEVFDSLSFN